MYVLELAGQDDDFAAYEARSGATAVDVVGAGLATARGITDAIQNLAFTHRASELLGQADGTISDAEALLSAASIERAGTAAVRAIDVRGTTDIDTQAVERALGTELVNRGFEIDLDDPEHELRALFSQQRDDSDGEKQDICLLGWLVAESDRTFASRKPSDRPFFQPGSMDPMLARALVNMAGAGPDTTLLDPMCGTGGILLEAGLIGAAVVGLDVQEKMIDGSRQNLAEYLDDSWELLRGNGATVPLRDDAVDAVVFDTPYGRQSKIEGELETLVANALAEARRVAPRCVVVGDRPWTAQARTAGWTIDATFERRVHRSLSRYILSLER